MSFLVTEYQNELEKMCIKVLGFPDYFIIKMFILGLKEHIQNEVLKRKPQDIQEAYDLALLIENKKLTKLLALPTLSNSINKHQGVILLSWYPLFPN